MCEYHSQLNTVPINVELEPKPTPLHSPLTSVINKVISLTQMLITGCYLFNETILCNL